MQSSNKSSKAFSAPKEVMSRHNITFNFDELIRRLEGIRNANFPTDDEVGRFKLDYLISELQDKYPEGGLSVPDEVKMENGLRKLLSANARCKEINENGYDYSSVDELTLSSVLQVAAQKCRIRLENASFNVYKRARFSNGATTDRRRTHGDPFFKYHSGWPLETTAKSLSRVRALINCTPMWVVHGSQDNIIINNADSISFVAKNAQEFRAIVPQQSLLCCLQLAWGLYLKDVMAAAGSCLRDQTRNQRMACYASISGSHATVDLKNASALMNYRIVWDLLPPFVFQELDALRNTHGRLPDGNLIRWEMFSSMGNGYNFELESLIFLCLCEAAAEHLGDYVGNISVYGDDIIVPSSVASFCCDVLRAVGFDINEKKTHITGPFRESCGAHFYRGYCVKPFYIKKAVRTVRDVIRLSNRIRLWASCRVVNKEYRVEQGLAVCDPRFYKLWREYAKQIPKYLWGGQNLDADYAIVSAGPAQKKLSECNLRRPINGWRAFLRYAQSLTDVSLTSFEVFKIDRRVRVDRNLVIDVGGDSDNHHLTLVDEKKYLVRTNYDRNADVPLFPQEEFIPNAVQRLPRPLTKKDTDRARQEYIRTFRSRNEPSDIQYRVHSAVSMFREQDI